MTLRKRKVTAQIAEHRSCWTVFCAEYLNVQKIPTTCEIGTRGQVLGQVPGQVFQTLEYSWCNPENLRKAKKRAPRCQSAPGPILSLIGTGVAAPIAAVLLAHPATTPIISGCNY